MKKILLSVCLLLLLASCSGTDPALTGRAWQLVSYGPLDAPVPALPGVDASATFGDDGTVSGNMGCNSFSGDYKVSGSRLKFGQMMSTLMACMENERMDQESAVLGALNGNLEYKIDGDILTIWYNGGKSALIFRGE